MKPITQKGCTVWIAEAPNWTTPNSNGTLKLGMMPKDIEERAVRGQRVFLGQLYGIVGPGLIMAEHVYQGFKRGMHVSGNSKADRTKLSITWAARHDFILKGDKFNCTLERQDAVPHRVFAVYASPNEMLNEFPDIYAWIEHWTWVAADPCVLGAPVDHTKRYDQCLWSRSKD